MKREAPRHKLTGFTILLLVMLLAPIVPLEPLGLAAELPTKSSGPFQGSAPSSTINIEKQKELQVNLIQEITRTIITLSTAILAVSASLLLAFGEKFGGWRWWPDLLILLSWGAMVFSILFGTGVLQGLVTNLEEFGDPRVFEPRVINDARLQILIFIAGIGLFLCWTALGLKRGSRSSGGSSGGDQK